MLSEEQKVIYNELQSRWDSAFDCFPKIIFHDWINTYQELWKAIYGKTSLGLSKLSKCECALDWIRIYGVDDRDYIETFKDKKIDLIEEYLADAEKAYEAGGNIYDHPDYPEDYDESEFKRNYPDSISDKDPEKINAWNKLLRDHDEACGDFEKNWTYTPTIYLLERYLNQTKTLALIKQKNITIESFESKEDEDDPAPVLKDIKKKEGVIDDVSGWIYVLRHMESGLYKIGKTKNWESRLKTLKVDYKTIQLMQLKWVENRHLVENYHHTIYEAYRLPQSEWFKLEHQPII